MDGGRYAYSCWQDDSIVPNNLPERDDGFVVNLQFCNRVEKANDNDAVLLNSYKELFNGPNRVSYEDDDMEFLLYLHLRLVNIPERFRYSIIDEVLGLAHLMLNDVENADKKVLPISVDIVVRTLQSPFESEQEAIARALRESADAFIGDVMFPPVEGRREFMEDMEVANKDEEAIAYEAKTSNAVIATKSSIQALEYVKHDKSCLVRGCYLCKQRFSVGMVVTRLPCSHIFHGDCIVRKLVEGNLYESKLSPGCALPCLLCG